WPGEARDNALPDRVVSGAEDDRNRGGCRLGRQCHRRATGRDEHRNSLAHQISRQCRQSLKFIVGPAVLDRKIYAFAIAGVLEALGKSAQRPQKSFGRLRIEKPNHRHRRLLRARRQWPRRRAAEQRDELTPSHSITSSAMASSVGGTLRPSAFAVLRL